MLGIDELFFVSGRGTVVGNRLKLFSVSCVRRGNRWGKQTVFSVRKGNSWEEQA